MALVHSFDGWHEHPLQLAAVGVHAVFLGRNLVDQQSDLALYCGTVQLLGYLGAYLSTGVRFAVHVHIMPFSQHGLCYLI